MMSIKPASAAKAAAGKSGTKAEAAAVSSKPSGKAGMSFGKAKAPAAAKKSSSKKK